MRRIKESQLVSHYGSLYYDMSDKPQKLTDTVVVLVQDKRPRTLHRVGAGVVLTNDGYKAYYCKYGMKYNKNVDLNMVGIVYKKIPRD